VLTIVSELNGWVEKKQNKKLGASWQNRWGVCLIVRVGSDLPRDRYMVVKKPGVLIYYKDENIHQVSCRKGLVDYVITRRQEPAGQVDLRLVMSFTVKDTSDDKKLTEAGRLDLDLADRTLKLRWVQGYCMYC
jgi:hypothetical protein